MNSLEMRDIDFEKISRLVYGQCGINLHEGKKELVKARLGKRLREGNFRSFADYYKFVTTEDGTDELISMIDSISTNLTFFFREESHFQKLRQIIEKRRSSSGEKGAEKISIWSAGCSTGEEPYSLAITLRECENGRPIDARIVATDISTRVLKAATQGIYPMEKVNTLPTAILKRYFQRGCGNWSGQVRVKPDVQQMVKFTRFNLMEEAPADFRFDIIFCRNVMIYFDKDTQSLLVNRFHHCLNKGGYFFVGHSESLTGLKHAFKYVEPSVYRK
ncbi:MAG: protein-glutamate O-methyltransferase [Syntrophales bacterium]|jgi:chemotaxis protein methyltransferase CheR|nr:protein-glutamate O-methyltransferase [Syntrophales bacterium]